MTRSSATLRFFTFRDGFFFLLFFPLMALALLSGCGGTPAAPAISVSVSPATATLIGGANQTFNATVTNDSANAGVTWTASTGAITSAGIYTAPAVITTTSATVTATSKTDTTKSASATITLTPISVSVSPSTAILIGGANQTFTATVTADGANAGVTWTASTGTVTAAGVYTAPAVITTTSATVTATSKTDTTKSASATITLTPISIAFTTATTGITLDSGQTLALAASVANDGSASGATFTATGAGTVSPTSATGNSPGTTLTATSTIVSAVTVTATSVKDTTKTAATASITVNPALAITTAAGALAAGVTNTAYTGATIATTGGTGAKTFALASGSLPAGFTLSSTTGVISGAPTGAAGTSTFTVKVTDSATIPVSVTSGTYTISVTVAPLVWVSPTTGTLTYAVGTAITPVTLSTTGGTGAITYTLNSGTLPSGLSISGNILSGTPTAPTIVAGNLVNFLATDSATPTHVTATSANATLIVNPVTLAITSTALPTGTIGAAYSYQLTSTGGTGAITWSLSAGSLAGTGLTLSSTGLLSGTPTATETALSLTFQARDSATNQQQTVTKTLPLTVTNALAVTTTSLTNATAGVAYNATLAAAGGSGTGYTWTVTSGATGTNSLASLNLTVSSAGVINGTSTTAGTASFTVQVKDSSNNTASASFTITAYAVLTLPAPNPGSLGSATTSSSYTGSITATGGVPPYTWTVNSATVPTNGSQVALSDGLYVDNTGTGVLSVAGTPTSTGTVTFTAKVTDSTNASAGPFTYTVAVSTTYTVSGNISLINNCNGITLPAVTVAISSSPVQTTTTNNSGNFSFSNLPNGTYTLTPSITGPSAVFYPATQTVTVTGGNITNSNFSTQLGYAVSGTVAYSGSKTGQIYLALNNTNCGGGGAPGTSISSAGSYTIRGVAPGSYTLQAFMDNLGEGASNASNPTGSASLTVATANDTGANVTLADPATVTLTSAPSLQGVAAFNTGVIAQYKPLENSSGVETATSYTLQWSTTSTFAAAAGSKTFSANGAKTNVLLVNGLTNGSAYYFRLYGTSAGTATSAYSSTVGPITIGAPTGGNTVTGAVSFAATPTGPLYVAFYQQSTGAVYAEYFANPASPQTYSIQVPTGSYTFVGILDQNNNGIVDAADVQNTNSNNTTTIIGGATANENLTLPTANSTATVTTQNSQFSSPTSSNQSYSLNFTVAGLIKRPVSVTVSSNTNASGADVVTPMDIALCNGNNCGSGFQANINIAGTSPAVGDSYTFTVTYSDGTTGTVSGTVTAVLNAFATNLLPACTASCSSTSTTPTFTWIDPANASDYVYQFNMNDTNGNTIWQIPGNNSNSNGFSSSITSITWGTDPTGGGSTPSISSLVSGTTYQWQIQVQDSNGNQATTQVTYQP
jgi:large repetitive protein